MCVLYDDLKLRIVFHYLSRSILYLLRKWLLHHVSTVAQKGQTKH